jgi:hypothetical protein
MGRPRVLRPQLMRDSLGSAMNTEPEAVQTAIAGLPLKHLFHKGDTTLQVVFLLPHGLWRPLRVSWWTGKEVCIIGGDVDGNYFLRHSDGSVRLWRHSEGREDMLAPSVRAFVSSLQSPSSG